jgi:propanol-preferring alcohol dehydrogenase
MLGRDFYYMKAMVLKETGQISIDENAKSEECPAPWSWPLEPADLPIPRPGPYDILIKISACGVCHTELDQVEGRITPPKLPVIPGHQPVGIVEEIGDKVTRFRKGGRAGATWIYSSCGNCISCARGLENLCPDFKATGSHADGGYAEYMVIGQDYAHEIPDNLGDLDYVAPLMCSGAVGFRSLMLSGIKDGMVLGLYGFGSAHHLVIQMAGYLYPASKRFVFARNPEERELALKLGADWAGDIDEKPPRKTDCAIDTTPVWRPVVHALENLESGGRLVMNLIRKEDADKEYLLKLDYTKHLWMEKEIKTVANVTRKDGRDFLALASDLSIRPQITSYPLEEANKALIDLKSGKAPGSKILKISG